MRLEQLLVTMYCSTQRPATLGTSAWSARVSLTVMAEDGGHNERSISLQGNSRAEVLEAVLAWVNAPL